MNATSKKKNLFRSCNAFFQKCQYQIRMFDESIFFGQNTDIWSGMLEKIMQSIGTFRNVCNKNEIIMMQLDFYCKTVEYNIHATTLADNFNDSQITDVGLTHNWIKLDFD